MLSRIADSLFWLNRYMERSDCLLRVIHTNYILSFDATNSTSFSWKDTIGIFSYGVEDAMNIHSENTPAALNYLINDTKNLNAVKTLLTKARENARGVQDNITKEVWEQVNQLYHLVNQPALEKKLPGTKSLEIIEQLYENSALYYGVTDSTMPRGQGWNFMNLGKFIERCLLTIDNTFAHFKKIDHQLNNPQDVLFWRNLLLSLSGYELYLKTYTSGQHNLNVIDHVIFNKNFPRSLMYSLHRIKRYLDEVVEDTKMEGSEKLLKAFGRISSKVEFADMNMVQQISLPQYLYSLRHDLVDFSNQLTRIYFSYA
ncbi:MAG TPA: alpha-E domain-containing protein [Chitinophagaceae bacterium]|nr:alpha-E domain-containing protein [Chitinophagaceae bacterium]